MGCFPGKARTGAYQFKTSETPSINHYRVRIKLMENLKSTNKASEMQDKFIYLDRAIQADIEAGENYGASVLVARNGKVLHQRNYGDAAPGRKASGDDLYLMMSLSKAFTASMVLKAIDEGKFTLDTRVDDLLPGFGANGKQTATVFHLLNHTSGLPFALVPPPLGLDKAGNLSAKATALSHIPASYMPGTRCIYTGGVGYDALGQILVNTDLKGRTFRQIVREDLFEPLGMHSSSFGCSLDNQHRVPVSFTQKNTHPGTPAMLAMFNQHFDENAELPSGNAYATIDDVFRFCELYRNRGNAFGQRIISPALFDYAHQDHTPGMINEAWTSEVTERGIPPLPASFTLLGGYIRGKRHVPNSAGYTASPGAFTAVGGGSTGFMIDYEKDVTVIFLSSGFREGLRHLERLKRINDLAMAAIDY